MQEITVEIPIKVRYSSTPYYPAKIDGPPEFCYPEEGGELEIEIDYDWLDFEIQKAIMEHEKKCLTESCPS